MDNHEVGMIFLTVSPLNIPALIMYLENGFIIYDYKREAGKGASRLFMKFSGKN